MPSFTAPPTNFSEITGQPFKIVGAGFLRVAHPELLDVYKQDRQLFYISEEGMAAGVTLSKSYCKNLGIIPPYFPMIGKADQEEEVGGGEAEVGGCGAEAGGGEEAEASCGGEASSGGGEAAASEEDGWWSRKKVVLSFCLDMWCTTAHQLLREGVRKKTVFFMVFLRIKKITPIFFWKLNL